MSDSPDRAGTAAGVPAAGPAGAEQDLDRVQRKVEAARAVLLRLLQDVVVAESRLSNSQAAQIMEANEQLVLTALRNQAEVETATQALTDVARLAAIDPLTQLPNRVLMIDRFAQAIATAKRHGARLALLFLDLDEFKEINDQLGHAAGDAVLQQVAQRLSSTVREADTVSRYGGDEFLILLTEVSQAADAALLAGKLLAALSTPFHVSDETRQLTASIGISLYPDDGETVRALIDRADAAMYQAKRKGPGSFEFHVDVMSPSTQPALATPASAHAQALAAHERRHAQLREANEHLVLAALDAQELKAAAQQAQQRQAEFMAAVAEELGSPFTPIRLATAMLGRARTDEPLLPRVQALVEQQAAHMLRLVNAASESLRRNDEAQNAANPISDMVAVIDAAVRDCRPAMDLRFQSLSVAVPAGPIAVVGDPGRSKHLLVNLLDNASKYTPDRGAIRLEAVIDGSHVVFTVTDDGIGITPSFVSRLFEPFGQDSQALGFNGVGAGLGLPVVRALVKEMGGTVAAESAGNGRGSRFIVTLPLAGIDPAAAGSAGSAGSADSQSSVR